MANEGELKRRWARGFKEEGIQCFVCFIEAGVTTTHDIWSFIISGRIVYVN